MNQLLLLSVIWLSTALSGVVDIPVPESPLPSLVLPTEPALSPEPATSVPSSSPVVPVPTSIVPAPASVVPTVAANINISQQLAQLVPNIGQDRLLFFTTSNTLGAISSGLPGQFLQSQGDGQLPQWTNMTTTTTIQNISNTSNTVNNVTNISGGVDADWASPGAIGSSTPNTGAFTALSLAGGSYPLQVGSSNQLQIDNNGRLQVAYVGDSGFLSSSGGVLFLNNTNNIGTGIGIYSNAGGEALGNMINVKVDNPLYNQAAFYMNYDGLSNAVEIVSNSNDSSSNALAVTGNNINDSTVGIIGYELARGTVKITHNRPPGGTDSSASGLSIDLKGAGTRAQGVYVDSTETGGTLGNLLRLRNESIDKFVVNYQGNVAMAGTLTQGANGTDTTFTKYGNTVGDEFFVGTNASFRIQRSASNSEAFRTQVAGDTQGRWVGTSDGRLRWGDGSSATDVTLRRGGVGILHLEGGMVFNNLNADFDTVVKGMSDSNLLYLDASRNAIGIGLSAPVGSLHISKNGNGNATLIVNQLGSSDILAASASGVTQLRITNNGTIVSPLGSLGIGTSVFGTDADRIIALAGSTAPSASITNGIQLFAVDIAGSHELQVRDEAGNVTTLSPHNFSLIPEGRSEDLAWAFYSERGGLAINADMTRALRLVEGLTGEQLIYIKDTTTNQELPHRFEDTIQLDGRYIQRSELSAKLSWSDQVVQFFSEVTFRAKAIFEQTTTFMAQAVFKRGIKLEGPLVVGGETAGWAEIPAGARRVRVTFAGSFTEVPMVYLDAAALPTAARVEDVNQHSFVISLDEAQDQSSRVKWLAVVATNQKGSPIEVLESQDQDSSPPLPVFAEPSPTPPVESQPVISPEVTPQADPQPTSTPTPSPAPTLEVAGVATDSAIVE